MDILAEKIIDKKYQNNDLTVQIFDSIVKFYKNYNHNIKIDNYTTKILKTNLIPSILIIKKKLLSLLKKYRHKYTKIHNTILNKKEIFYVMNVDNDIKTHIFLTYCIFYHIDCIHSKFKNLIGLDFEFNSRKISLCQVGFYPHKKIKYVFIFDPTKLTTSQKNIAIDTIFTQQHSYKIMHGSDSLDIPYICEELFLRNSDQIINFVKYLVDTRFLCEYYKIAIGWPDKKCSLYDALFYFNVINKKTYNKLGNITSMMGPIYNVNWNIKKISDNQLDYAAYDVIYLKCFVLQIFNFAKLKGENLKIQCKFISPIYRLWCYEKYEISDILQNFKSFISSISNYFVKSSHNDEKLTLNTVFESVIETVNLKSLDMNFKNFLEINNFKKLVLLLFKLITYSYIAKHRKIYITKNKLFNDKINYSCVYDKLYKLKLYKIVNLLTNFEDCLSVEILEII